MPAQKSIELNFVDFYDAVRRVPKMRRARAGATSSIPKDTLLSPAVNGVNVETPAVMSFVIGSGDWKIQVSVDARRLIIICDGFKKLKAGKTPGDVISISVEGNYFKVKFKTTAVTVPLLKL
jgi:hypothetical protein